ncbi:MAG: anti-sigma factor C-terminal domain-containing protein [Eubacteriales bacterium]|nr:anti-sigma factor C-terminal domain-containing protein [Eubacteriales bacterium]
MTYKERLRKYKEGRLSEEEARQVEEEIEKYEAISDYLFEEEKIPELEAAFEDFGDVQKQEPAAEDVQFVELINRSIRRAFCKLGIFAVAVSVVLALLLQFCIPALVSCFYYNPGRKTGEDQNQMSLDMAVYTELFLPGKKRTNVVVDAKGYGKYDIRIIQNISYNRRFTSVSGEVTRGKLKLYDDNILTQPTGNCFAWCQAQGDLTKPLTETMEDKYNMCAAGTREDSLETLNELDEHEYYIGYVSLNQMMPYEEFKKYLDEQGNVTAPWCAIKTSDGEGIFRADNIGFECGLSSSSGELTWDQEKYPKLILWDRETVEKGLHDELMKNMTKESFMQTHFISLLTYLSQQEKFMKMMGIEDIDKKALLEAADYVEENGLTVYGYAGIMNKETALALSSQEEVYEIYIEDLR